MSHIRILSRPCLVPTAQTQQRALSQTQAQVRSQWRAMGSAASTPAKRDRRRATGKFQSRRDGDERDLVGLPDPISNLRPVIYASPFHRPAAPSADGSAVKSRTDDPNESNGPAIGSGSTAGSRTRELENTSSPYSNSEFLSSPSGFATSAPVPPSPLPSLSHSSPSGSSPTSTPTPTYTYTHRLALERLDRSNHDFWAESNLLFEGQLRMRLDKEFPELETEVRGKLAAEEQDKLLSMSPTSHQTATSATESETERARIPTSTLLTHLPTQIKEDFLSNFYADWVNANEQKQKAWVKEWWREVWWTGVVGGWRSWREGVQVGGGGRKGVWRN